MSKVVEIIRMVVTFLAFGVIGQFLPDFLRWGFLGYVLLLLALKIETLKGEPNE